MKFLMCSFCAGTIIDNKVCHPRNYDFYLCAHAGMIVSLISFFDAFGILLLWVPHLFSSFRSVSPTFNKQVLLFMVATKTTNTQCLLFMVAFYIYLWRLLWLNVLTILLCSISSFEHLRLVEIDCLWFSCEVRKHICYKDIILCMSKRLWHLFGQNVLSRGYCSISSVEYFFLVVIDCVWFAW